VLLVHAITPSEARPGPDKGLRGQQLVCIEGEGLTCWATELRSGERFTTLDLLEQHKLVSHIYEQRAATLPARFPTWFADAAAVRERLRNGRAELSDALERVRGRSEFAVTALWTPAADEEGALAREHEAPSGAPEGPLSEVASRGTRYLLERQKVLQRGERQRLHAMAVAEEIQRSVGADLVDVRRQVCPSARVALSLALLVPREAARNVDGRLPRRARGVRILVSGPWPPYSFAGHAPLVRQA
jgi:hypothetical protein